MESIMSNQTSKIEVTGLPYPVQTMSHVGPTASNLKKLAYADYCLELKEILKEASLFDSYFNVSLKIYMGSNKDCYILNTAKILLEALSTIGVIPDVTKIIKMDICKGPIVIGGAIDLILESDFTFESNLYFKPELIKEEKEDKAAFGSELKKTLGSNKQNRWAKPIKK
jgi:hypothetical protein